MDQNTINSLSREQCVLNLKEIGQGASGTVETMRIKLNKFYLYPKLYERMKTKASRQYKTHHVNYRIERATYFDLHLKFDQTQSECYHIFS